MVFKKMQIFDKKLIHTSFCFPRNVRVKPIAIHRLDCPPGPLWSNAKRNEKLLRILSTLIKAERPVMSGSCNYSPVHISLDEVFQDSEETIHIA